jgi:hypothetical protein
MYRKIIIPPATLAQLRTTFTQLRTSLIKLRTTFTQLRTSLIELRTTFIQLRTPLIKLRTTFTQLRTSLIKLRTTFIQLRTSLIKLRTTFIQLRTPLIWLRTTLKSLSPSLKLNAIKLSLKSLKGIIFITAGQRPAAGTPSPLSLPGRQNMAIRRCVLPFRQQIWHASCHRRSLTCGYANPAFQAPDASLNDTALIRLRTALKSPSPSPKSPERPSTASIITLKTIYLNTTTNKERRKQSWLQAPTG